MFFLHNMIPLIILHKKVLRLNFRKIKFMRYIGLGKKSFYKLQHNYIINTLFKLYKSFIKRSMCRFDRCHFSDRAIIPSK